MTQDSNLGHQLLRLPSNSCLVFASEDTQGQMPLLFTNDKHVQEILNDVVQKKDDSAFGEDEDEENEHLKVAREEDDALYKWTGRAGPHRVTNHRDKQATDASHMASKP